MTSVYEVRVFMQVCYDMKTGRIILAMNIDVEFIGVSRVLSGVSKAELSIPTNGSYRDVIRELSKKYPQFIGQLIDTTKQHLHRIKHVQPGWQAYDQII